MTQRRFPPIPGGLGRETIAKLKEIAEIWQGARGNQLDRVVTFRDLTGAKIGRLGSGGSLVAGDPPPGWGPGGDGSAPKCSIPPAPTGFDGAGAVQNIMIWWDSPHTQCSNIAYTEVWRHDADVIGSAVKIADEPGPMYVDPTGPGKTYFYWVRHVSTDSVEGPYNAVEGLSVSTSLDVPYLLDILDGQLAEDQLIASLRARIDLVDEPGTGLVTKTEQLASVQDSDNLFVDGNFARAFDYGIAAYWDAGGGPWSIATDASTGKRLMRFLGGSASSVVQRMPGVSADRLVQAEQGDVLSVVFTAWRTVDKSVTVQLLELSESGVVLAAHYVTMTGALSQWVTTTGEVTLTHANTAWVRLGLHCNPAFPEPAASLDAYFRSVRVTRGTAMSAFIETRSTVSEYGAEWTIKTDVNGHVAGIGLLNSGNSAKFAVVADQFTIAPVSTDPATVGAPFYHLTVPTIVDGVELPAGTYLRTAFIGDATISTAKVANAFLDNLTAVHGTLGTARIQKGDIFNLTVGDEIKSEAFVSGSTGWRIRKNGTAEFSNGTFRGHLEMDTGYVASTITIGGSRTAAQVNADLDSAAARGRMGDNLSFEAGDTGWVKGVGFVIVSNASAAHTGSWLLAREASGTELTTNAVRVPVVPGERLTVGGHIRRDSAHTFDAMGWRIVWLDSSDTQLATTDALYSSLPDTSWHFVTADGVAPATAAVALLQAIVFNQSGGGGALLWDDGYIERATVASSQIAGFRYAGDPLGVTRIEGGKIFSDTAFVGTLFIEDRAVTIPESAESSSSITVDDWTTILDKSINSAGGNILVSFDCRRGGIVTSTIGWTHLRVLEDGIVISELHHVGSDGVNYDYEGNFRGVQVRSPGAGVRTYTLQARRVDISPTIVDYPRKLFLFESLK